MKNLKLFESMIPKSLFKVYLVNNKPTSKKDMGYNKPLSFIFDLRDAIKAYRWEKERGDSYLHEVVGECRIMDWPDLKEMLEERNYNPDRFIEEITEGLDKDDLKKIWLIPEFQGLELRWVCDGFLFPRETDYSEEPVDTIHIFESYSISAMGTINNPERMVKMIYG